jgi:hypothetical protein
MVLEKKKSNIHFNRISNAVKIFNTIFSFLSIKDTQITVFEVDPFPSFKGYLEKMPMELSSEKLKLAVEKSTAPDDLGIEISSTLHFDGGSIPILFTLLPLNRSNYHDVVFEFIPNGNVKEFMDIQKYIGDFRNKLVESIERYHSNIKKEDAATTLKINKAFISTDTITQHDIDNYKLFYSREQYEIIIELFSKISDQAKERLTLANRNKVADTLIGNFYAFNTISKIATNSSIDMRGGSIIIIPEKDNSMKEFAQKTSKLIDEFINDVYVDKETYNKKLSEVFTEE